MPGVGLAGAGNRRLDTGAVGEHSGPEGEGRAVQGQGVGARPALARIAYHCHVLARHVDGSIQGGACTPLSGITALTAWPEELNLRRESGSAGHLRELQSDPIPNRGGEGPRIEIAWADRSVLEVTIEQCATIVTRRHRESRQCLKEL